MTTCRLSRPKWVNLAPCEKFLRPFNLLVNLRSTDSSLLISCLNMGFQTSELNSSRGRTKTQKALLSRLGLRDWKQLKK